MEFHSSICWKVIRCPNSQYSVQHVASAEIYTIYEPPCQAKVHLSEYNCLLMSSLKYTWIKWEKKQFINRLTHIYLHCWVEINSHSNDRPSVKRHSFGCWLKWNAFYITYYSYQLVSVFYRILTLHNRYYNNNNKTQ